MGARFNPPPGWPAPPDNWRPTPNWVPDPSWPAPPSGWQFWILDEPAGPPASPWTTDRADGRASPGSTASAVTDAPGAGPIGVLDHGSDTLPDGSDDAPGQGEAVTVTGRGRRLVIIGAALAAVVGSAAVIGWVNLRGEESGPTPASAGSGITGPASPSASPSASVSSSGSVAASSAGATSSGPSPTVAGTSASAVPDTALAALESLSGRTGSAGPPYLRSAFGTGWADLDRNGCDTGNDVLARDLSAVTRTGRCVVVGGKLLDPYVGRTVTARSVSGVVALDFVVPLADAWINGAGRWTAQQRTAFLNDPRNLQAIQTETAQKKRSRDASGYLPSSVAYRCAYVARQVGVKLAYGLGVGDAERGAMRAVLATCPRQPLPQDLRPTGVTPPAQT